MKDERFNDIAFKWSYGWSKPFTRYKVSIRKEIITYKIPEIDPNIYTSKHIAPKELKKWYDEERDFNIIDARNNYEYCFGTFKNSVHYNIDSFSNMPNA